MQEIEVKEIGKDPYIFEVTVEEKGSSTNHQVEMDVSFYEDLSTKTSPREIVKKSFEFLLKREPKEAILSKFNLKVIGNYFPGYKEAVKNF